MRRATTTPLTLVGLLLLALWVGGCGTTTPTVNRSFSLSAGDAERALAEMEKHPKPLERPVVVLSGYSDPGIASALVKNKLRRLTGAGEDRILDVSFMFCWDFDDCRDRLIAAVDRKFPTDDPQWTAEVDVVAVSMGGVVARYGAAPGPHPQAGGSKPSGRGPRRLKIARLFTISSPHRGAKLAVLPTFNRIQLDLRKGSKFMNALNRPAEPPGYELFPYARLNDAVVGEANCAPEGCTPMWVSTPPLEEGHVGACMDARIVADIARRLRGEEPYATNPPAPLPGAAGRDAEGGAKGLGSPASSGFSGGAAPTTQPTVPAS